MSPLFVIAIFIITTCMSGVWTQEYYSEVTFFTVGDTHPSVEVEPGADVNFLCQAEGRRPPDLMVIGQRSNKTVSLTQTPEGDMRMTGQGTIVARCESTDLYHCVPNIELRPGKTKNVTLFVKCPPKLNTTAPVETRYFSTADGNVLEMKFTISAYPVPLDYRLVQTSNTTDTPVPDQPVPDNGKRRKKREIREVNQDLYQVAYYPLRPPQGIIVLQMYGLNRGDSGQYSLDVNNGIGNVEISFNVNVEKEKDDDDTDIHTIIGTVCGIIGAVGVIIPGMICAVKHCRTKK